MKFQIANAHFLRALREKWGVKTVTKWRFHFCSLFDKWTTFFKSKNGQHPVLQGDLWLREKEKRKKTVPAENLIIQRMRWCQVAWLEFESRALLIYDLSHSMKGTFLKIVFGESRGKAKYGTRPTHSCDWIWLNQFSCHTPRHTLNLNDKTNICLEDDEMRTH